MTENLKQSWAAINHREHHQDAAAKRVVSMPNGGLTASFEDTNFESANSPALLDVNTALGRNGVEGYISCDGAGSILVEFSDNGTDYGGQHTLKADEVLNFDALNVDRITITHSGADSSYRVLVV